MKTKIIILLIISFMTTGLTLAVPNKYETKVIREQIETSFTSLFQMWMEELYFEMYDHGQKKSKQIISKPEFAQRMVDLKWKPTLKPIEIMDVNLIYRNFAAIKCLIEFENKVNQTQVVAKEIIFPVILEDSDWKFNLIQLIRSPYIGKYYIPPKSPEKKALEAENKTEPKPVPEQPQE